jgi:predicted metal-dependent hydrolase
VVDRWEALEEGIRLFNERYFFEAHDVLEEAWMEITNPKERLFYQGLIQLAVGFYHLEGGNLKGADDVLSRGIAKLRQYEPEFMGVRLTDLLWKSGKCLNEVQAMRRGERVKKDLDPSMVPVIRYEENKGIGRRFR